jgi:predicted RNase H-like nuclease (RuvC/YqgF family)
MSDKNIIRNLPRKKGFNEEPKRFTQQEFNAYSQLNKSPEFKKWFKGINPKTNRKINKGGNVHNNIAKELKYDHYYEYYKKISDIKDINEYNTETKKIYKKWNNDNKKIEEYNNNIETLIKKISKLKWNEHIELEGEKYGIPIIHNNIHKQNECNGKIKIDNGECHTCENGYNCGRSHIIRICLKCKYKDEITEYSGPWWI